MRASGSFACVGFCRWRFRRGFGVGVSLGGHLSTLTTALRPPRSGSEANAPSDGKYGGHERLVTGAIDGKQHPEPVGCVAPPRDGAARSLNRFLTTATASYLLERGGTNPFAPTWPSRRRTLTFAFPAQEQNRRVFRLPTALDGRRREGARGETKGGLSILTVE